MTQNARSKGKPQRRRWALVLLAGLAVGYCSMRPFFVGEQKMKDFCGQVAVGMPQEAIAAMAAAHEYKIFPNAHDEDPLLIVDSKAMGRFICEVRLEQGRAAAARYIFND